MRPQDQAKLGFFPLPIAEAKRLKHWLNFPEKFAALDPCVGDGVAFTELLWKLTEDASRRCSCAGYWM